MRSCNTERSAFWGEEFRIVWGRGGGAFQPNVCFNPVLHLRTLVKKSERANCVNRCRESNPLSEQRFWRYSEHSDHLKAWEAYKLDKEDQLLGIAARKDTNILQCLTKSSEHSELARKAREPSTTSLCGPENLPYHSQSSFPLPLHQVTPPLPKKAQGTFFT